MTIGPYLTDQQPGYPEWWDDAACAEVDPELFFPQEGATKQEKLLSEYKAKQVCSRCPVRTQCLSAALDGNETFGVWGGLSAKEREMLALGESA